MSKIKNEFGKSGEDIACEFLKEKGYEILKRNERISHGEIDIIAKYNDEIIFVEVKSRQFDQDFSIFESINSKKKKSLFKSCGLWLLKNHLESSPWRIDFIGLTFKGTKLENIEHLEGGIY